MSFSTQVKAELCRASLNRKCCAQAEAYGVLLYCSLSTPTEVRITTESPEFADRLPQLFQKAFQVRFDRLPAEGAGKRIFSITDPDKLSALWSVFGHDPAEALVHHINYAVLEEDHCRTAFLRGAFLAGGSVTDPAKRYHLELATSHLSVSRELHALLLEMGFSPKESHRKANAITYFKQSNAIEDFLTAMGAPLAAMDLMNAKAEKDLRGSINRRVNCDAANLDKAVDAAQGQIEAIYKLEERGMLEDLPDKLKEAVDLRMAHPELTLSQLAELCDPPVSKSAFNHRLRKLVELSKQ
ncbi:MAG: DNA-binding protein WhiA [Clostridiales bacterium]|uniref:DNA-binding protein WhiA n=1 Tax=Flavonifractor porci TaxID=3133422 RepID=UPI00309D6106|nr:DNA-binding protein WhiA [Clostridiales bacterium]